MFVASFIIIVLAKRHHPALITYPFPPKIKPTKKAKTKQNNTQINKQTNKQKQTTKIQTNKTNTKTKQKNIQINAYEYSGNLVKYTLFLSPRFPYLLERKITIHCGLSWMFIPRYASHQYLFLTQIPRHSF